MKRLFRTLILPAMMMATLSACGGGGTKYNELCAKAADSAPLLLNSSTGKEIYASTHKRELADFNSVLGLKSFTYNQKEFAVEWEMTPADKWTSSTYILDETRVKMAPNYGSEGFEASLKCTVSYVEKEKTKGKAELTWQFDVAASTVTELTLEEINTRYVANGNKIGDMDGLQVGTRGIVTSSFEDSESHLYAGVFIQDGEHSLQLYAGSLRSLWVENKVKVGDCIFVVGPLSFYGVIEMKPTMLEVVNKAESNITDPVTINLDDKTFDGATLMANQSSLVSVSNVTYVSGNVKTASAHATIKFSKGETEIPVYCNYHIGETAMLAVKTLVESYTTSTVVSIKGILSFYDGNPQIIPVFGTASFIAPQAA